MDQLLLDSSRFEAIINLPENKNKRVVIDEIQKFPKILDTIHQQIHKTKRQFVMTGSSARKLKQQSANLLAGRAWIYNMYPLSTLELTEMSLFDLKKILEYGGLPEAVTTKDLSDIKEYLRAYVATYLEKEIQQEQWVKKLEPFRKFLAVAAQMNGKIINCSKISREIGVNDITVANYFEILTDTLVGFQLSAFSTSVRKAQKLGKKFYFIDTGIKRALEGTLSVEILPKTFAFGDAFEHWVILEFVKNISIHRLDWKLSYLRTKDDLEIDLIVERPGLSTLLIEIKSTNAALDEHVKSLELLGPDIKSATNKKIEKYLFSLDVLPRTIQTTHAIHWIDGLKKIFQN
jgi:predicted AAA+ superfamily ATPase